MFDVSEAVLAAAEQLGPDRSAGLSFLPRASGATCYDRRRLLRVFANLLSNAMQSASPDRRPRVEISSEAREGHLLVRVKDNGIGIEERHFERIFRLFERIDPSSSEGTGVGLSILKRIAGAVRREIGVQSVPGVGSTFSISVPRLERRAAQTSQEFPMLKLGTLALGAIPYRGPRHR
jgi:signal transduction histidine kinase